MTKTYYATLMVIRSLRRKAHTLIEDSLVEDSADPYGGYHRPLYRQAQTLSGYDTDLYEGEHRYIRRTNRYRRQLRPLRSRLPEESEDPYMENSLQFSTIHLDNKL